MKYVGPSLFAIVVILFGCGTKSHYEKTDLSFFNVKGKVKRFGEIKVIFDLDPNGSFDKYDRIRANYYIYNFDSFGNLVKIDNINPSPYAVFGYKIDWTRTEDTLFIKQTSDHEIFTKTYSQHADTLNLETYDKLDDDNLDYHSEKYQRQIFTKNGNGYSMKGYMEGITNKGAFMEQAYATIKNMNGHDSLVYLVGDGNSGRDTIMLYSVAYPQYDANKNWLHRQFKKNDGTTPVGFNAYSEYRNIEYYQ